MNYNIYDCNYDGSTGSSGGSSSHCNIPHRPRGYQKKNSEQHTANWCFHSADTKQSKVESSTTTTLPTLRSIRTVHHVIDDDDMFHSRVRAQSRHGVVRPSECITQSRCSTSVVIYVEGYGGT